MGASPTTPKRGSLRGFVLEVSILPSTACAEEGAAQRSQGDEGKLTVAHSIPHREGEGGNGLFEGETPSTCLALLCPYCDDHVALLTPGIHITMGLRNLL